MAHAHGKRFGLQQRNNKYRVLDVHGVASVLYDTTNR